MIFTYVLFGVSLKKAFQDLFTDKVNLKRQFCENAGDRVLLKPLIM